METTLPLVGLEVTLESVAAIYNLPLARLVRRAVSVHSLNFPEDEVQASSLLSVKTGGCPENCSYCPQSAHYKTGVEKQSLMGVEEVVAAAEEAKRQGATRFCMGAAWREVRDGAEFDQILRMVSAVAKLELEVCCTLGMLKEEQAHRLKEAGLGFYNHNIDTSPEYYDKIIQTRTFGQRIETLQNVRQAGLSVCTGGIIGLGESHQDRVSFIRQLVSLEPLPESITVNVLVRSSGTPLENQEPVDPLDVVRMIAALRVLAPQSMIRLSAGRLNLSKELQFLCFLSGANSIFLGEKLLTSPNPEACQDMALLAQIGFKFQKLNSDDSLEHRV